MKIQVLGVALAGILSAGVAGNALAGPGDDPASVIAARAGPGESTAISDGPNGFQIVGFFLNSVLVSTVESGTPNLGGGSTAAPVSGSVNPSYGAVADSGVESFIFLSGFNRNFNNSNLAVNRLLAPIVVKIDCTKLKEQLKELVKEQANTINILFDDLSVPVNRAIVAKNREIADAACDEKISVPLKPIPIEVEREVKNQLFGRRTVDANQTVAVKIDCTKLKEQLKELVKEQANTINILFDDLSVPVNRAIVAKNREIADAACDEKNSVPAEPNPNDVEAIACTKLNEQLKDLLEERAKITNIQFDDLSVPVNRAIAAKNREIANAACGEKISMTINTPYTSTGNITPAGANGFTGSYALANPQAKRPWVLFVNSAFSGLDDERTGADRRARMGTISTGGKILWNSKTTFGLSAGYSSGKVTSQANASKLTGDYFSATFSGDYLISKTLSLGFAATYIRGENTLEIGGGTGEFDVDVFTANASLSDTIQRGGFTISPSLSAGISRVIRDSYTDSNAVFVPGSEINFGNVNFGTSISKTFRNVDEFSSITPSVSLGGGYFFREKFDAALTSGATAKELGLGANLATGLDLRMDNGIGINFGASYGLFQNDIKTWSLNAKLTKAF